MKTIQLDLSDEVSNLLKIVSDNTEDFIIKAVKKSLLEFENKKIENFLIAGYKSSKKETKKIQKDFSGIDIENWDEY